MRIELNPFEELEIVYNNTTISVGTGVTDSSRITISVDPRYVTVHADEALGYVAFEGPKPRLFARVRPTSRGAIV